MHDLLRPVAFLLGEWEGEGEGSWAGGWHYRDTWRFSTDPSGAKPVIEFRQQTASLDGNPSHGECGYIVASGVGFHVTVAEPSGIAEVLVGTLDGASAELACRSTEIAHSPTTDNVTAVARRWRLDGESLVAEIDIGVNGEPLAPHTRSVLRRCGA